MKKYVSHKEVEAAPITAAEFHKDGSGKVVVRDEDGTLETFDVPPGFCLPGKVPNRGDFLVKYQPDGYLSWSPEHVFRAGYTVKG